MRVVVIGGGLTGLSTAYHLGGDTVVYERDSVAGGVAGSTTVDGFVFDHTGHLLHFKDPRIQALLEDLLPGLFQKWDRRSSIWRAGIKTEYPFQVNTHGHPPELVADCLVGFAEAYAAHHEEHRDGSFKDWILRTFGSGFAEHFFVPYNEKFWRRDLSEITADWVSWAIPRPELRSVVEGGLGIVARGLGYNPSFQYPRTGGIDQLAKALATRVSNLNLGVSVERIETATRTVRLSDGRAEAYDHLVSTMPLPTLVQLSDVSDSMRSLAGELDHVGVLNFNLGINRANCWDDHWTYFPEPEFPFYRIGVPTNFSDGVAPPGTTSYYVEVTYRPEDEPDPEALWPEVLRALQSIGAVRDESEIAVRHVVCIPHAYVVFNEARKRVLPQLLSGFEELGVTSVGRYGAWEYASMEKALVDGIDTADRLRGDS